MRARLVLGALAAAWLAGSVPAAPARAGEVLYATEGNRLRRVDLETGARDVLIENADGGGLDINGMLCPLPDRSGRFVAGEDTGQPSPPPGWGVFDADGTQVGKLTATYRAELGEPHGCAFDAYGRLFTTSVGNRGFGPSLGQLIVWFPPYARFPGPPGAYPETDAHSDGFCKLATDIGTAGGVAIDAEGRVYVASSSRGAIYRFSPPFPTSADAEGGCGARDELGSPKADPVQREVFVRGLYTFSGLAFAPDGRLFASSVLTGVIVAFDENGEVDQVILDPPGFLPPHETGTPQGIAFDAAGTLYYADLDLVFDFPTYGPGPNGVVRRIRFAGDGTPQPPEVMLEHLAFPDGVTVVPGELSPPVGR